MNTLNIVLVTVIAENIEIKTPIKRAKANPLIKLLVK